MALRQRYGLLSIVVLATGVLTLVAEAEEVNLRSLLRVDQGATLAELVALRSDWTIDVRIAGESKSIPASKYVHWGSYKDQSRAAEVLLTDGTILVGEIVAIGTDSIDVASRLWGEVHLDRRSVSASISLPPTDSRERDRQRLHYLGSEPPDRLHLLSGDTIAGRVLPTTERNGGGLFGLVSVGIEPENTSSNTLIQLEDLQAITFKAGTLPAARRKCLLGFDDGSLIPAISLSLDESERVEMVTGSGALLRLSWSGFVQRLSYIQPLDNGIVYLSDLAAVSYKSLPFLTLKWPLGVDQNVLGGCLRLQGEIAFKGIGMHSSSRVAYVLDGNYRRFQAELALDDQANRQGSVVYHVLLERPDDSDVRTWGLAFTSPIIRGGGSPVPVSVDVASATRMALVVEMADRADTRDYANWLNARLMR